MHTKALNYSEIFSISKAVPVFLYWLFGDLYCFLGKDSYAFIQVFFLGANKAPESPKMPVNKPPSSAATKGVMKAETWKSLPMSEATVPLSMI